MALKVPSIAVSNAKNNLTKIVKHEVLRKNFNAPDRDVIYSQLYFAAKSGNLMNAANNLKALYPSMTHIINKFIYGESGSGSALLKLNAIK